MTQKADQYANGKPWSGRDFVRECQQLGYDYALDNLLRILKNPRHPHHYPATIWTLERAYGKPQPPSEQAGIVLQVNTNLCDPVAEAQVIHGAPEPFETALQVKPALPIRVTTDLRVMATPTGLSPTGIMATTVLLAVAIIETVAED
jgi:hypothetical protein